LGENRCNRSSEGVTSIAGVAVEAPGSVLLGKTGQSLVNAIRPMEESGFRTFVPVLEILRNPFFSLAFQKVPVTINIIKTLDDQINGNPFVTGGLL
jgi:hypothetical protein